MPKRTTKPQAASQEAAPPAVKAASPLTKLAILAALLKRREGATIGEMIEATGWQPHSIRGAMAGGLKKAGHAVTSEKTDGLRRYRIAETQA